MMEQHPQRIDSQEELDALISSRRHHNPLYCFILLRAGLKASKDISFNDYGDYCVYNNVDDTTDIIEHDDIMSTYLGEAIEKGLLYKY